MENIQNAVAANVQASAPSVKLSDISANVNVTTEGKSKAIDALIQYTSKVSVESAASETDSIEVKSKAQYINDFKVGVEKTARSTLEMCRVVYEANRTLEGFEFSEFCNAIGFKDYSSTTRKFIAIGKLYPRFIQYADVMPHSWTNIYLITQIPSETFEQLIKEGTALNKISGSKLVQLAKGTRDIGSIEKPLTFDKANTGYVFGKLLFTKKPDDTDWRAMEKAIAELSARLPIKFVVSKEVTEIVNSRRAQKYEKTKKVYNGMEMRPDLWDLGVEANSVFDKKVQAKTIDQSEAVTI
ncbi:hypothetical protein [Polynucleobacter sp. 80A-SIGWE]|uniref:hypothetical protein n=1 Tax=Polynucleobacter sp. 80A-SIGWE TaxID=2689100 RepID=UPI001C0CB803|nr:hypothetical protein [Polynucleobacter sp. 80A-SIGWE]MBU3589524.1 hypothetical protein [Polynucleobacter sp. 80A-SIGWE]